MNLVRIAMTTALVLTLAVPVTAATINMTAAMDGPQANAGAGSGSPGLGTGTVTFDTVTKVLSWSITWNGLIGTPTLMHFHGPALPNQNAGVQVGTGVVGPPVVGNTVINLAQEADLLAGLWYLNLHTTTDPAGEIRGQVLTNAVPVQETSWGVIKALFSIDY